MGKSHARKLNTDARLLVKQWVVEGLTNSEIRVGLAQRGYPADLTDSTFTEYRQDPQVKADTEAAVLQVRIQGMASRIRRVRKLHDWTMLLDHRINGTTPRKDCPDVADHDIDVEEVETGTLRVLIETGLKCFAEMGRLVDDPVRATATIVNKDVAGNVTGSTTMESNVDPELLRISARAQVNDAIEAALDLLEAEAAEEAAGIASAQNSEAE